MIRKTMKKILLATLLISTLGLTVGCGSSAENKEVHIGYFNNVTHAQALLMKANGNLESALGTTIPVKWTAFNAGPAEVEALFAEDIDIGYIGPVPAINANVKSNGDVVVLAGATKAGAILVTSPDSDITTVADLSGKTVAIPQIGNTQHLSLLHLLKENNLAPVTDGGTVNISAVANADVANMMERGDIDAALVPEPWGATLLSNGAKLVLDEKEIYMDGNYDVAVVVVRKEYMKENPDIVQTFLTEHEKATAALENDVASSLEIINKELEAATGKALTGEVIQEAFSRIGVSTTYNKDSLTGFANISLEQGLIKELPSDETLYAQ